MGEFGGSDAAVAYRRFVEQGIQQPPASPFAHALQGWILGSQAFADRLRSLLPAGQSRGDVPQDHKLRRVDVALVWQVTAEHYRLDQEALGQRGRHTEMRSVAAWTNRMSGKLAPEIELPQVGDGTWRLSDHRGRPVLLVFHRHLG